MSELNIRLECLRPAHDGWMRPTGAEVREVLKAAGLRGTTAAKVLGLSDLGGRTVRRWMHDESDIPYAAWALLCDLAGQGSIWRKN